MHMLAQFFGECRICEQDLKARGNFESAGKKQRIADSGIRKVSSDWFRLDGDGRVGATKM